ncbi:pyruvate carboxylase [Cokeromyces recurvatus]|uniref:pyruvate carboxylase n=1 Tax=Cokeromyces recurvatus TaxID=90255 RepID=UPI00221E3E34|nr:pyruvate carboxylase [Cokeromyces recurvatus]KAI7899171.1 pyruvate carboxylase [Cokeromyces recurvatus]
MSQSLSLQVPAREHSVETIRRNSEVMGNLRKLMVANRGEIAIRCFRTAHELSMRTADESYQIGQVGQYSPVGAYLAQDEIVRIAKERGVSMIHPGYGFLSENAEFARKVEAAGITFIGPSPDVIDSLGDKTKARTIAIECGVPVVPGTPGPVSTYEEAKQFIDDYAAMGGGGRGMRVVRDPSTFEEAFNRAKSEALSAFGDGTVFIERFLDKPRHIEVQLLADRAGNVVHLFERDCSVQRRHQKVVEIAPAKNLDPKVREAILNDAIKIAKAVKYKNAGTAEFLVDNQNRHYFIEINPRIQVEHTITEEITGIDIVAAQIQIAAGALLPQLGLTQQRIRQRGYAIQCRVTTEDPEKGFQPDTGKIEVYRSSGGNGVRLDGGAGFAGAVITPHYDSLLVKVTCTGSTFEVARRKIVRALVEFRIRGVKTNIPFLQRLVTYPTFITGTCWTTFIDDTPDLFELVQYQNRAQRMLGYLGDVVVNGSQIKGQVGEPTYKQEIEVPGLLDDMGNKIDVSRTLPSNGWRQVLLEKGPEGFAKAIREHPGTLIMDTTWRDAHQSLLATRVRTLDLLRVAPTTAHALANAFALECWGGATFDVSMRFLHEDPWDRLMKLRKAVPNIPFQMLLRGANAVGYTSYPDNVIYEFCDKAVKAGMDIFRVFDSLNYKAGGVVEATLCYTGDVSNPNKRKYTLDYYLDLAQQLVNEGIHILGIKDMAGLLKPKAAKMLIEALRERFPDLPIHVHTHDTAGTGVASMIAASLAGADIVDAAIDSMSGMTSQPAMGAIVAALEQSDLHTGIDLTHIHALNTYWEQARLLYSCFEANVKSADSGVYDHEMPGGQYTNLMFQSQQLGLGSQWVQIKKAYAEANKLCGDLVKVTPSSKVVGDLAQFMVSNGLSGQDVEERAATLSFPTSVVEFFQGYLGQPYGGFPEPLRSNIIKGLPRLDGRPGASLEPLDLGKLKEELTKKYGSSIRDYDVISAALYPQVFADYRDTVSQYGDLSVVPTRYFLSKPEIGEEFHVEIEEGKTLIIKLLAVGPLNNNGKRDVYFELNGEARVVGIADRNAAVEVVTREKANPSVVIEVKAGDQIAVLSAMKMETVVTAPIPGRVDRVVAQSGDSLSSGDLVIQIVNEN